MAANEPEVQRKNPFGIGVSNLTPEIIQKFQLQAEKGVMVVSVEPGSKGEVAGIIPGDLIKEINYQKVTDVDQYMIDYISKWTTLQSKAVSVQKTIKDLPIQDIE